MIRKLRPEFDALRAHFPAGFDSSMVLPCLRRIQEERGFVADSDIDELVEYLGVARIQVEEALSFYTHFRRQPIGRWHLQVCHNVSCSMRGAETLLSHLQKRLGIEPGQTTPDGRCTLGTVECLGSCGTAPAMMVNERYLEKLTLADVDKLLEELK
jgi:NADH-quinone oxidoreductase subunit E